MTLPVLIKKIDVCQRLGLSMRCLEMMVNAGQFPPPVRLGKRAYWSAQVVDQWLAVKFQAQADWMA